MIEKTDLTCIFDVKSDDDDQRGVFTGVASTSDLDLQGDIIEPGAFEPIPMKKTTGGVMPNVLMLRDHDRTQVIGGWRSFKQTGHQLIVEGELALEVEKARETYALMRRGFMSGLSVGFSVANKNDIYWASTGKRHIKKAQLRECSIVSYPANTNAQIVAVKDAEELRSEEVFNEWLSRRGIEPDDLEGLLQLYKEATWSKQSERWTVSGARDLPIAETERSWDAAAARTRIFARANIGTDSGTPNPTMARRAFLIYDAANPELRGSYSLPFADIVDGVLKVIPSALRAAASRLPQVTGVAQAVKDRARRILDAYFARLEEKGFDPLVKQRTEYADPGYLDDEVERHPIDTPGHVRSAWRNIHLPSTRRQYTADQVRRIEARIIRAWKRLIHEDGPPKTDEERMDTSDNLVKQPQDDTEEDTGDEEDGEFADPGYLEDEEPRHPINTEPEIRAAWKNIHSEDVRGQYDNNQIRRIEHRIIAAWKRVIDESGPPAWRGDETRAGKLKFSIIDEFDPEKHEAAKVALNDLFEQLRGRYAC